MDDETKRRLDKQDEILEKIYVSAEKTRKYFLWVLIISIVVFVLPLLGVLLFAPSALDIYTSGLVGQ
jgi:hypothetical protein